MTTKIDGGSAFPAPGLSNLPNGEFLHPESGMTLREYLATKFAVAWVLSITACHPTESREEIGIEANRLGLIQADHMLNQRNKS